MRVTRREIPEVSSLNIVNKHLAVGLHDADAGLAGEHNSPLIGGMPVQFAERARGEPHVDAGEILRRRKLALRYLVGPAAALHALRGEVEGVPDRTGVTVVGEWRSVCAGILP